MNDAVLTCNRAYSACQWFGYPDDENTLQAEADMVHASDIVNGFWRDVGEDKRDQKQYTSGEIINLKLRSTLNWRSTSRFCIGLAIETNMFPILLIRKAISVGEADGSSRRGGRFRFWRREETQG